MPLSFKNKVSIFCTATLAILLYQNCSQNFKSATANQASNSNEGNNGGLQTPPTPSGQQPSMPPPPVIPNGKTVDVFMASGHMARTLFSCDDGRTWRHDQSQDDSARCWVTGDPKYVECDHTAYSSRGLTHEDGLFFTNFGWGENGSVRRSIDGVNWQIMRSNGWGGGVSYTNGLLFLLWNGGIISANQGDTWQTFAMQPSKGFDHPSVEKIADNRLAMIGRASGVNKVGISLDGGLTWNLPATLQVTWLKSIIEGNGRMVGIGYLEPMGLPPVSYSAISTDQGATWMIREQTGLNANWGHLIFDGSRFVTWSSGKRWHSTDGLSWTSSAVMIGDRASNFSGPTAFNPTTGTYARILGGWGNNYARQKAYRSGDGIIWQELPASAFNGGHPVGEMIHGQMDTAFCQGSGM